MIVFQLLLSTLAFGLFQVAMRDAGKLLFNMVLASLLSTWNIAITLLHVGVNDLLNDESQDPVQTLLDNLKQIGLKCKSAGVTRILISGIVVNKRLTSAYISSVNQRILICAETTHLFLLTTTTFPHQVSFAMVYTSLKSEKRILANNFIDNLNNFLRVRKTHRPPP